jgi:hypothetical protein
MGSVALDGFWARVDQRGAARRFVELFEGEKGLGRQAKKPLAEGPHRRARGRIELPDEERRTDQGDRPARVTALKADSPN